MNATAQNIAIFFIQSLSNKLYCVTNFTHEGPENKEFPTFFTPNYFFSQIEE